MVKCVAGCQPPPRGDPLIQVWAAFTSRCGRDGVGSRECITEASLLCCVCLCGLGCLVWWGHCWRWGCGVVGLWWCLACVPCLLAVVVVHGWVACVVGLAPALGIGCWAGVDVCGACCGCPPPVVVVRCSALLCCAVCCAALPLYTCAPLGCTALCRSFVRLCQLCLPRRCVVLCCSGVCCGALFRCAHVSALVCRTTPCVVLH